MEEQKDRSSELRLQLELYSGHCYRALNRHIVASKHYTVAQKMLHSTHNMHMAAELYLGLGYCMHAGLYQQQAPLDHKSDSKAIERTFQLASSYLMQCRTLYQVSGDSHGEMTARLMQATVLLDYSDWNESRVKGGTEKRGRSLQITSNSLLDEAEEQCRQLLSHCSGQEETRLTSEIRASLYTALTCLIRIFCQRAKIARLNEYHDTALHSRLLALYLCQQILNTLKQPKLFWSLIGEASKLSIKDVTSRSEAIPRAPDFVQDEGRLSFDTVAIETFFVMGEVIEELSYQRDLSAQFIEECIESADKSFLAAIQRATEALRQKKHDAGYFSHLYQRYVKILEQRHELRADEGKALSSAVLELLKDLQQLF